MNSNPSFQLGSQIYNQVNDGQKVMKKYVQWPQSFKKKTCLMCTACAQIKGFRNLHNNAGLHPGNPCLSHNQPTYFNSTIPLVTASGVFRIFGQRNHFSVIKMRIHLFVERFRTA